MLHSSTSRTDEEQKKKLKNLYIEPDWPNPAIVRNSLSTALTLILQQARAYFEPNVNQDDEAFSWAGPDLDGLRTCVSPSDSTTLTSIYRHLQKTLSWNSGKVDELLLPLIKRQNDRKAVRSPPVIVALADGLDRGRSRCRPTWATSTSRSFFRI